MPEPKATLVIALNEDGTIGINGPITNKLLCYGMLQFAEDLVRSYDPANAPRIEIPQMAPPAGIVTP